MQEGYSSRQLQSTLISPSLVLTESDESKFLVWITNASYGIVNKCLDVYWYDTCYLILLTSQSCSGKSGNEEIYFPLVYALKAISIKNYVNITIASIFLRKGFITKRFPMWACNFVIYFFMICTLRRF